MPFAWRGAEAPTPRRRRISSAETPPSAACRVRERSRMARNCGFRLRARVSRSAPATGGRTATGRPFWRMTAGSSPIESKWLTPVSSFRRAGTSRAARPGRRRTLAIAPVTGRNERRRRQAWTPRSPASMVTVTADSRPAGPAARGRKLRPRTPLPSGYSWPSPPQRIIAWARPSVKTGATVGGHFTFTNGLSSSRIFRPMPLTRRIRPRTEMAVARGTG